MTTGMTPRIPEAERDEARAAIDNALATFDIRFMTILLHVLEDAVQFVDPEARRLLIAEAVRIFEELYPDGVAAQPKPVLVPGFQTV